MKKKEEKETSTNKNTLRSKFHHFFNYVFFLIDNFFLS